MGASSRLFVKSPQGKEQYVIDASLHKYYNDDEDDDSMVYLSWSMIGFISCPQPTLGFNSGETDLTLNTQNLT